MSGSRKSITMLESTEKNLEVTGPKIRGDSYFGYTDGLHTVQVTYHNFTGGFGIQATLSLDPKEEDWFWVPLKGINDFDNLPVLTYPKDPLNPTGDSGNVSSIQGDTGTEAFTFTGNFTYLRAVVTRNYIEPAPEQPTDGLWLYGQVDNVKICL